MRDIIKGKQSFIKQEYFNTDVADSFNRPDFQECLHNKITARVVLWNMLCAIFLWNMQIDLCNLLYAIHFVQFALHSLQFAMCIFIGIIWFVQFKFCNLLFAICLVKFALCNFPCAIFFVQFAWFNMYLVIFNVQIAICFT